VNIRLFLTVLVLVIFPAVVFGQMPGRGPSWGPGAEGRKCSPVEALDLSEGQRQAVHRLDLEFRDRILRRWEELTVKRHELQTALSDPDAEESLIRARSAEMIAIQNDIHQRMLDHQLEIRKILRPDQIRRWCAGAGGSFSGRHRRGSHGAF
jgi:Spy/CpxP family protein refolding chaperone